MSEAKRQLFDARLKEQRDFWIAQLSREIDFSGLPLDHARTGARSIERVPVSLTKKTQQALLSLTSGSPFLLFTALFSALKVCLNKYNESTMVVVGAPAARKENATANLLAIVDELDAQMSFRELLTKVHEN